MSKKQRYTANQVATAIREARGFLSIAAQRLGCDYSTVWRYSQRYESVQKAIDENREKMKDIAEAKLFEQIQASNMTAIIFYLKCLAKDRGYVERQEVTGAGGKPIEHNINLSEAWREILFGKAE
jgi:hypothetical protein